MSRIGKQPIVLPAQVEVSVKGLQVAVKGPKGSTSLAMHPDISLAVEGAQVILTRPSDGRRHRALHGLVRSLVQNMVTGVSTGFEKSLHIEGVGYRAQLQGKTLTMSLGYSHPIEFLVPDDVKIEIKDQRDIAVRGIDRQRVGQVAADIRHFKPPEPYKGTGIRYVDEHIRRKEGKAGAK